MDIEIVPAYRHTQEINALFSEYTDTLPFLESAIHMYEKFGFTTIDCYNDSPMSTSIYMRLDLK